MYKQKIQKTAKDLFLGWLLKGLNEYEFIWGGDGE